MWLYRLNPSHLNSLTFYAIPSWQTHRRRIALDFKCGLYLDSFHYFLVNCRQGWCLILSGPLASLSLWKLEQVPPNRRLILRSRLFCQFRPVLKPNFSTTAAAAGPGVKCEILNVATTRTSALPWSIPIASSQ